MSAAAFCHIIRRDGRALLAMFLSLAVGPLGAQQLDWEAALPEASPAGDSVFTEVVARPGVAGTASPTAVACGHFTGTFQLGAAFRLENPVGQDGVVAFFEQRGGWNVTGLAQVLSDTGDVTVNDLVVLPGTGQFYIAGFFQGIISFSGSPLTLSSPGAPEGFVAWGEIASGDFVNAFPVSGMLPTAIAVDDVERIYVAGGNQLARRYPAGGGAPDWATAAPAGTDGVLGLATSRDLADRNVYSLIQNGTNFRDVVLIQLNRDTGDVQWASRVGGAGAGNDLPGGVDVDRDGDVRIAFSTNAGTINYLSPTGNLTLPNVPEPGSTPGATHAAILRIDPAGELVWAAPLGSAQSTASQIRPTNISIDDAGNTYACATFSNAYLIESVPEFGTNDTAVFGVDGAGLLFDFHRSTGPALDIPAGISAPQRDLVVTVGDYANGESVYGGFNLPAPALGESRAFFSPLGPVPNQELLIFRPDPGIPGAPTVQQLIDAIHQLDGQVYNVVERALNPVAVSAYVTPDQRNALLDAGGILFEEDFELEPDGQSADAGWALNQINDASTTSSAPYPYTYPDTGTTVNVYLVDTAVDVSSGWFDANSKLTVEPTTLVRGSGDPVNSSVFQHGTEMLSLVGGPDTGVALGTPVVVKNFDFYPNGSPTTASLLADAIYQVIDYHTDADNCRPGVMLISSSGASNGSAAVSTAIAEAIAEGIPVVVSAGNATMDAALFIPASSGTTNGVICVAASTQSRALEPLSNFGTPKPNNPPIDLAAPGAAVRVVDYNDPLGGGYGSFTGTSASAALTAGVAAVHLSTNPWSTPADLESALRGDTATDGTSGLDILQLGPGGTAFTQTYDKWAAWYKLSDPAHDADEDNDGWTNLGEYIHGLKPTSRDSIGAQSWITYDELTDHYTYRFTISTALLDLNNLGDLLDGGSYEVTHSGTLTNFSTAPGTLKVGGSNGPQTELNLENPVVDPECFLQLEVTPASPSP